MNDSNDTVRVPMGTLHDTILLLRTLRENYPSIAAQVERRAADNPDVAKGWIGDTVAVLEQALDNAKEGE